MTPYLIKLCTAAFYEHKVSDTRAAELADEVNRLIKAAGLGSILPSFEDAPDRFLAELIKIADNDGMLHEKRQ